MRIRNFIVADAISQGPDGKFFVHGGGVTSIDAFGFPYAHPSLGVLITLVYEGPEDDVEQHIEVVVAKEGASTGNTLLDMTAPTPPDAFEARESWRLIHLIGTVSGLQFEESGLYWVALRLNDREVDRMVLMVSEIARPPELPSGSAETD